MVSVNLKQEILEGTMQIFLKQGLDFTMNDIAKEMHIAKKTIYACFPSKENLLQELVNYGFANIQDTKKSILKSDETTLVKLRQAMIAMPASYMMMDYQSYDRIKEQYPSVAAQVDAQLEANWEPIFALINQGKKEGVIRLDLNLQIFREMTVACFERLLQERTGVAYQKALNQMMDIVMGGIVCDQN